MPLHVAAQFDYVDLSKMLREKGTNIEYEDKEGWTDLASHLSPQTGCLVRMGTVAFNLAIGAAVSNASKLILN